MCEVRILIVCHDLGQNAAGRAEVLWQLSQWAGWEATVLGLGTGGLWPPLRGTAFETSCRLFATRSQLEHGLRSCLGEVDVVIAMKTLPESLGTALRVVDGTGVALVVDIDDPDYEARYGRDSGIADRIRSLASRSVRGSPPWALQSLRARAITLPRLVSNPVLERWYGGGTIIPHARAALALLPEPSTGPLRIAFVGTPRAHKGVEAIRAALVTCQPKYVLTVTAPPPVDARPWEEWIGFVPYPDRFRVLRGANVVALPSTETGFGRAQLPAKLLDAMLVGRAIIAGNTEPIRWALGGTGIFATSEEELVTALNELRNPERRQHLATAAREEALERFTIGAVGPVFTRAIERARAAHT